MPSIRNLAMSAALLLPLSACMGDGYGYGGPSHYGPPPGEPYYADQYYRDDPRYREHRLRRNDMVYQGRDGRYYCKRSDGSTGLIVGGIAGGLLGNIIAPGGSKTLGTLLGAAGGAAVGTSIDKDNVRCR
ncbi:glycine zipper 2TM domain-containing protein [Sphingomonas sp. MMS24-J13]|uniref:glycine zipper 2TM domain-containing protein n=1 Tax=Sphingomonas sp. MMS24-J13 TaxID=3238686 RepID=UPI0038507C99